MDFSDMIKPDVDDHFPRSHGAQCNSDGSATFRLWAPAHEQVQLKLGEVLAVPLEAVGGGWHQVSVPGVSAGTRYGFALPDGTVVPDPASHYQPGRLDEMSELIDPRSYEWSHEDWTGRPWHTAVVYEVHVGTFTEQGNFAGVIERLDALVSLGVTAIELMPIGAFPGRRNWGYDVAFPYACANAYGRPDDLKRLIDAAHQRGLMVLLDVVYNHFGPEGNFLSLYAPQFFTERHQTPWGAGINFDGAGSEAVREFFIGNAIRWIREFHFDGLRLDAVHAIVDDSARHFLPELAERVRQSVPHRIVHLILENEDNQAKRLVREPGHGPVDFTAQWNDDVHHVLHVAATAETFGYYADYQGDTLKLARALSEGFAFQGEFMPFRGSARGEPSGHLPSVAFVAFVQNHDQIGNRARGERWDKLACDEARHAVAAVYLLLPQIPMLFMGEEWSAAQPFPFFCDFEGDLAHGVRTGRQAELSHLPEFSDPSQHHTIPDPLSVETFQSAVLRWEERGQDAHGRWLDWYQKILTARRREIVPRLLNLTGGKSTYLIRGPQAVSVQWLCAGGERLQLDANLSAAAQGCFDARPGRQIWLEGHRGEGGILAPWTVEWSILDA
jgi:malto-oligosyltrehalose trehalohydrolase